eukprot:COSAG01_NODE_60808_length_292_cov_2.310881_1_plen_47_part_10
MVPQWSTELVELMPAVLGYRHDATFAVHTIACQCYEAFFNSNRGVRV